MADEPHLPVSPTDVWIDGKPESDDYHTKWTGGPLNVSAVLGDNLGHQVRLVGTVTRIDKDALARPTLSNYILRSDWVAPGHRAVINLNDFPGLVKNANYRVWLTNHDKPGNDSKPYKPGGEGTTSVTLWTDRPPIATPVQPQNNTQFDVTGPIILDWQYDDNGDGGAQTYYQVQWKVAGTNDWEVQPAVHTKKPHTAATTTHTIPANTLQGNRSYYWQVRVKDEQGTWSAWSVTRDFYTRALTTPPRLEFPIKEEAVDASQPVTFEWKFLDPERGDKQKKADIRYRIEGTEFWTVKAGVATGVPGVNEWWTFPSNTFIPGVRYEWQAETVDQGNALSAWSSTAIFQTVRTPGWALDPTVSIVEDAPVQGALGCGHHRVFVYRQGGQTPVGEITPIQSLQWGRLRDDISGCLLLTNGFGVDCGQMLSIVHTWMHELVVFRDGVRVWEGPITRIADHTTHVEIEAKDVMAYLYRRILRQGYNDTSYHIGQKEKSKPGVPIGTQSAVERAAKIITNALAYRDPNVLPYLTVIRYANDAKESRIVPDYSRTAWEEVDDLASNQGIDYVAVGRRIMIWDTNRAIGILPEMRAEDFSNPPVLTEYGMQFANYYAVTDNNGTYGVATPLPERLKKYGMDDWFDLYGPVEMLSSSYGSADGSSQSPTTNKAKQELVEKLKAQAGRGIAHRWPAPMVVRVPDNSTLNPEVNVGIQQLIPGVWVPLRFEGAIMSVAQWQKLDSVTVNETSAGEQITVVMSPAPNDGDPDAEAAAEAAT